MCSAWAEGNGWSNDRASAAPSNVYAILTARLVLKEAFRESVISKQIDRIYLNTTEPSNGESRQLCLAVLGVFANNP